MAWTQVLPTALAAAAFLLGGCSERPAQPAPPAAVPITIEPRVSVGKVRAGMTLDQVIAKLGQPQRRTAGSLEYTQLGFAVIPGPDQIVQVVMCGDVTGLNGPLAKAFAGRTKEGIGLTSTREDLLKAYGPATSTRSFLGGRESWRYDSLGLIFSLEAGKVHHLQVWFVSRPEPPASIEITQ